MPLRKMLIAAGLLAALAACSPSAPPSTAGPTLTRPVPTWAQTAEATADVTAEATPEATIEVTAEATAEVRNTIDGQFVGDFLAQPVAIQDFTLPSNRGELRMSALDGTWRLVFFGYTHCPDFCPLTLVEYMQIKQQLDELAEQMTFVFISVDGARDTAPVLTNYLNRFDPEFVGFSGDDATLAQIQPDYGFYFRRRVDTNSVAAYLVDHSTRTYLIDPDGNLVASFQYDTPTADVASALRWWIEHGGQAGADAA